MVMPMQGLLFFVPILSSVRQDSSTRLSVEPTRFTVDLEGKKDQLSKGAGEGSQFPVRLKVGLRTAGPRRRSEAQAGVAVLLFIEQALA
jgi:hypothetical protein